MKKRVQTKPIIIKSNLSFDEILKACANTPPLKDKKKAIIKK